MTFLQDNSVDIAQYTLPPECTNSYLTVTSLSNRNMKMDAVSLLCLYLFAFISAEAKPVHQTQLLGCTVRIPLHEIRQHFSGIRHHVVSTP